MKTEQVSKGTYHCPKKTCPRYQVKSNASMTPSEYRSATGGSVRCGHCGTVSIYRPMAIPNETN